MLVNFNDFSVQEIDLLLRLAQERASEILGTTDPIVVTNVAQMIAMMELGRAIQQSNQNTREGIDFMIESLQERN